MRTDAREMLAVGVFGAGSQFGTRIESMLQRGRTFTARASTSTVIGSAIALGGLMIAGSFAPRWIAFAQDERPAFEVASVKRDVSGESIHYARWFPALHIERMALRDLVALAWQVHDFEITGGPGWIGSDLYNIDAKAEAHPVPNPQFVAMQRLRLQTLLRDRFQLAIHREIKDLPVYELTVAKGGAKLQRANCIQRVTGDTDIAPGTKPEDYCGGMGGSLATGRIEGSSASMAFVSYVLSGTLSRTVVDKTGLAGDFRIHLTFAPQSPAVSYPDKSAATADPSPDFFTAMQEQLGLKLESAKDPVEVLVIDHAERPSEN